MSEPAFVTETQPSEHSGDIAAADVTAPSAPESGDDLQGDAFRLPVVFNKQDYHLTREEATTYAQKGMKFDTIEPMLQKLKTMASEHGMGVRELVDVLCDTAAQPTVEQRLAEEFCDLRSECPAVTTFDEIPETVIRLAIDQNLPLLDAYLRFQNREQQRKEAVDAATRRAEDTAVGTQHSAPFSTPDPAVEAMLAGVRG